MIHRDLKPSNVRVTPDGGVRVLDFGLAKEVSGDSTHRSGDSSLATTAGTVLGTPYYMSPEQARGQVVDRRTDVWGFGCILYETLTRCRPFSGDSFSDVLAAIVHDDPDFDRLPKSTPPRVVELLESCFEKHADFRLRDVGDARLTLLRALREEPAPEPRSFRTAAILGWIAATVLTVLWIVARWDPAPSPAPGGLPTRSTEAVVKFAIDANVNGSGPQPVLALSRDGQTVAWVDPDAGLRIRRLDQFSSRLLEETRGAAAPFFSPDGEWLGFFRNGQLEKILSSGRGSPLTLCAAENPVGGTWCADNTIVFAPRQSGGLWSISAESGRDAVGRTQLTHLDPERQEVSHRWPHATPDGSGVLFTVKDAALQSFDQATIDRVTRNDGSRTKLLNQASFARLSTDQRRLWFGRRGSLHVIDYDPLTQQVRGDPATHTAEIVTSPTSGVAQFAVAAADRLAWLPGGSEARLAELRWIGSETAASDENTPDAAGELAVPDALAIRSLSLAADGKRAVLSVAAANDKLWLVDMARQTLVRFTTGAGNDVKPRWSPDASQIVFASDRSGTRRELFLAPADGSRSPQPLRPAGVVGEPSGFTADGRSVLFDAPAQRGQGRDIYSVELTGDAPPLAVRATSFDEFGAVLSPNGQTLAWASNENGHVAIYAAPWPITGPGVLVADRGEPNLCWSPDSAQLYFRSDDQIFAQRLTTARSGLELAGEPELVGSRPCDAEFAVDLAGRVLAIRRSSKRDAATHTAIRMAVPESPPLEPTDPSNR